MSSKIKSFFLRSLQNSLTAKKMIPIIYVTTPVLWPSIIALGIDPVWYGVVLVMNLMVGLITPPFGIVLFAVSGLFHEPIDSVLRGAIPFLAVLILSLLIAVFFPQLSLFLPSLMM